MITSSFSEITIAIAYKLILIFATVFALFLYYRASRRELIDDKTIFDSAALGFAGALLGGRIFDFLLRSDFYNFSLERLFFFNIYHGFSWYGALFGALLFVALFSKKITKANYLLIFDLAAPPLVFGAFLITLGDFLIAQNAIAAFFAFGFLIVFWILKRLEKTRKFTGFLIFSSLILISLVKLILYSFAKLEPFYIGSLNYYFIMPVMFLIVGPVFLYVLSQRSLKADIKNVGAGLLLLVLKLRLVLTSVNEANQVAKSIVFLPATLVKYIRYLVKLAVREINLTFSDLKQAFGIKK